MVRLLSLAVLGAALASAVAARGLTAYDGSAWPLDPISYDKAPAQQTLAEAAAAPAAAPAPVATPVTGKAEGELTVAADGIAYDPVTGTLTLSGPSVFVLKAPDGSASTLTPAAVLAAGGRVTAPQDILVLGNSADGVPMKAIVRVSGSPTGKEDALTFPAVIVSSEEAVAAEGGVVQAAKAPGAGPPSLAAPGIAFVLKDGAVVVDGLRAPPPAPATPASGDANSESTTGGIVGGVGGYLLCGIYCAIAGGGAGYIFG